MLLILESIQSRTGISRLEDDDNNHYMILPLTTVLISLTIIYQYKNSGKNTLLESNQYVLFRRQMY